MYLESEDIIDQPAELIYALVRDDMPKLVPYLDSVRKIEMISKEKQENGRIKIVNHWHAKVEIPGLVKKFLKPDMFNWKDYALWNDEDYSVDYSLESFWANDLFDAKGTNYFQPYKGDPNRTLIKVTCNVVIHPEKIPGVPRLLAKKVMPTVESLLKKTLGPNLTSLGKGLISYFENQAS